MAGESLRINGDISGREDLRFEGEIEGTISVPDHTLIVGLHARVHADVDARVVVVAGLLAGAVVAHDRLELHEQGELEGVLQAPRLVVRDGAILRATVTMPERRRSETASPD